MTCCPEFGRERCMGECVERPGQPTLEQARARAAHALPDLELFKSTVARYRAEGAQPPPRYHAVPDVRPRFPWWFVFALILGCVAFARWLVSCTDQLVR